MAEPEAEAKKDAAEVAEGEEAPKKKGPLKLILGVVGTLALGATAAVVALPGDPPRHRFQGPYHHSLFEEKFSTNLKDNQQRRYLQTLLDCMYFAYDPMYLPGRLEDPLYDPMLRDRVGRMISGKSLQEAYEGPAREAFLAELRDVLNPHLFPLHIGATTQPMQLDEESGLRPGISFDRATFRGRYWEHLLKVDAVARTLQIDEGPVVTYTGTEEDLPLNASTGEVLYIDVTEINPEFQGEVQVGVHGRIRQLFARELIAQ